MAAVSVMTVHHLGHKAGVVVTVVARVLGQLIVLTRLSHGRVLTLQPVCPHLFAESGLQLAQQCCGLAMPFQINPFSL